MISIIIISVLSLLNFVLLFYIGKEIQRAFMSHEERITRLEMDVRLWIPPYKKGDAE